MERIDVSQVTSLVVYELKLFAPVSVNREDMLGYLDTGATQVTVSPRVARNLPRKGKTRVRSAFGEEEFEIVSVDVEFLGQNHQSVRARVHENENPLPFRSEITLDGPMLFKQPLIYDFRVLGLLPVDERSLDDWFDVSCEFLEAGLCIVEMSYRGKPVKALFDTGAGLSVMNARRIKEKEMVKGYEIEIGDAAGTKSVQEVRYCSGLGIGKSKLPPFGVFAVDLQGVEEALNRQIDIVFGANAMIKSELRWLFDMSNGQVRVAG